MPEAHARADVQQARIRGEVDDPDIQAQAPSRPENQGRIPDRISCRQKDQPLSPIGQLT